MKPELPLFLTVLVQSIQEISEISVVEYIRLIASFHADEKKEIDKSKYTAKQLEQVEKAMKLKGVPTSEYLNIRFLRPLSEFAYESIAYHLNLYFAFRDHGILPFHGCYADQPNKIIEIFNVFSALSVEVREREAEQQRKGSNVKSRR